MDGIHDMGGMDGFGSVYPEPNEPVFHEHWEGRVLALNRAMGASGTWTIDTGRFGIELLPPDFTWLVPTTRDGTPPGAAARSARADRRRRDRGGSCFASWRNLDARPFHCRRCRSCSTPPLVRPASTHGTAVQDCRPRAGEEHSSKKPYAPTALRARPCGRSATPSAVLALHLRGPKDRLKQV